MKRNKMCLVCYMRKKLMGSPELDIKLPNDIYQNSTSNTPLMGWSSWNTFKNRINQDLIFETAKAIKDSGLFDAGYKYVNLDDNWHSNIRDENGCLQGDLQRFSEGIPAMVKKINQLGMKVGIYSSNGTLTCEDLPASLNNEIRDARTFKEWGIEYLKYDFCHNIPLPSYAPLVYGIEVSKLGESSSKEILCSNGILGGFARRFKDDKIPGRQYVSGLDERAGYLRFDNVFANADGKHVLTINIKKNGAYKKYLMAVVNNKDRYEIEFPPQVFWNETARFSVIVTLNKGVNEILLLNPIKSSEDSAAILYKRMAYALKAATQMSEDKKPILFSICEWGKNKPWKWGASAGNMWRTTYDINSNWKRIMSIYERNVVLHEYASVGHFNDPDMLEVGNGNLNYEQNMAHFALWCMMSAPLVLGNDVRKITKPILDIVTNKRLIEIDQDALAIQAKRVKKGKVDVLAKPLANGRTAVLYFNKSKNGKKFTFDVTPLFCDNHVAAKASIQFEPIIGASTISKNLITAELKGYGVAVFLI